MRKQALIQKLLQRSPKLPTPTRMFGVKIKHTTRPLSFEEFLQNNQADLVTIIWCADDKYYSANLLMSNFVLETFKNLRQVVHEKILKISFDLKPMFDEIYKDFPGRIPELYLNMVFIFSLSNGDWKIESKLVSDVEETVKIRAVDGSLHYNLEKLRTVYDLDTSIELGEAKVNLSVPNENVGSKVYFSNEEIGILGEPTNAPIGTGRHQVYKFQKHYLTKVQLPGAIEGQVSMKSKQEILKLPKKHKLKITFYLDDKSR